MLAQEGDHMGDRSPLNTDHQIIDIQTLQEPSAGQLHSRGGKPAHYRSSDFGRVSRISDNHIGEPQLKARI